MTDARPNHIPGPNGLPPADLRGLKGWLVWRFEQHRGETKARKVPFYVNAGRRQGKQGAPADRAKLVTFDLAVAAAERKGFSGVGLAMLPEWGLVALDFDHCFLPDGSLPTEVAAIVSQTYSEYSPSGEGIRAFLRGDLGDHKSFVDASHSWGFEVFTSKGFVTVTGNMMPFTEALGLEDFLAPVAAEVTDLCAARFGSARASSGSAEAVNDDFMAGHEPPVGLIDQEITEYLSDLDPGMGRDDWIRVGMAIHHETGGGGFDLWDQWSSDGHQYPGTEALHHQWGSFDRGRS